MTGYRSWRRNTLLRLSLTMSSSSVSCSLAIRGMSSRTRCCMARHVRLSSCGGRGRDGLSPWAQSAAVAGGRAPLTRFWIPPPVSYANNEHRGDKPQARRCVQTSRCRLCSGENQQCQWSVGHTATSLGDWDLFVTET